MSSDQVLIVGSGPAGLILALSLIQNGISVRVIEKTKTHRIGQRGAGLLPRSLETFEQLGVIDEVLAKAISLPPFWMYKMPEGVEVVKEFLAMPHLDPTADRPYLNPMVLGQDNLDKIIRAKLEKLGLIVELGAELHSFEQMEDRVEVKIIQHNKLDESGDPTIETASYKWLVGADGAKSTVRKQLDLPFLGETKEQAFIIGDLYVEGLVESKWHMWGDMSNVMTSVRSTENPGVFNFMIVGSNLGDIQALCASDDSIKQLLKKGTANRQDIKWGDIICASPYRVNVRMVDNFRKGRVFVAGDAGHIHPPTGGQGMNTGIQDSYNLGWKLALVIKGVASESLLDTFNEERLPVVAEMLNITTGYLKRAVANEDDAWKRSSNMNQLGVNYRFSSIVVDEESETFAIDRAEGSTYSVDPNEPVRAGDRAPDVPGLVIVGGDEPTRLFKLFRHTHHTILILSSNIDYTFTQDNFSSLPQDLLRVMVIAKAGEIPEEKNLGPIYEDRENHAYTAYRGPDGASGIFVIRPDGVVGARVGSIKGVHSYFEKIFSGKI